MATIFMRTWTSRGPTGRRLRHSMYGYDTMIDGKRERRASAAWQTEAAAMEALTERLKAVAAGQVQRPADLIFGALVEAYLAYKADQKKRSLREDRRILTKRLVPAFGATRPVRQVNETLIAQYEKQWAGQVSAYTVANELTVFRHMLRLGRKWGYLDQVPDIELPKKPEARQRFLDEAEIGQLLTASAASRNRYLSAIVTVALNTGMRKAEILGLDWALWTCPPHA
jgi:integrase